MKIEKRVAYHCPTKELAKEFLALCDEQNIKINPYTKASEFSRLDYNNGNICFVYSSVTDGYLEYCTEKYYIDNGIPVVEFRGNKSMLCDKLIFNPPATILFKDGKKYVAKCHPDDTFDEMTGLMVALLKSFGIKYINLQEMLKTAKRPNAKIDEVDIENGKSFIDTLRNGGFPKCDLFFINESLKQKRGRPRKVETEEPKPKRPVGRPRKQKFEVGDYVKIKKPRENDCLAEIYKDKLYQVTKFDCNGNAVIRDYESALAGIYSVDRLELVKKGDKHEK